MANPLVAPRVRADLPATLQVGEPVVYRLPGIATGGDNHARMAFVTRIYRRPDQWAACDLLVLTGQDPPLLVVVDAVYDEVGKAPGTFSRNTGSPRELLTVAALTNRQSDPTAPAKL